MREMLTEEEYDKYIKIQKANYKKTINIKQKTCNSKFNKLHKQKKEKRGITFNEDWFINLTNIEIAEEIKWLLSMGKKFAIPIDKTNFSPIHTIAEIEQGIQAIENEREKDISRSKLATNISIFKRKIKQTEREKYITIIYRTTQKFLRKHQDKIIVTSADKGNKTVIMYKQDYKNKMEKLLENKNTYKLTRIAPTIKLQRRNNNIVTELFKTKQIDLKLKHKLNSSAANAPRLYGLPKIHNNDIPVRPI